MTSKEKPRKNKRLFKGISEKNSGVERPVGGPEVQLDVPALQELELVANRVLVDDALQRLTKFEGGRSSRCKIGNLAITSANLLPLHPDRRINSNQDGWI